MSVCITAEFGESGSVSGDDDGGHVGSLSRGIAGRRGELHING